MKQHSVGEGLPAGQACHPSTDSACDGRGLSQVLGTGGEQDSTGRRSPALIPPSGPAGAQG